VLFYASNPKGPHDVFRKSLDGAGQAELVYEAPGLQKPTSVSRDGRYLLINSEVGERNVLLVIELATGRARPLREGPFSDGHGALSPDGGWLLFESDETGRPEIYVTPFPGPGRTWPISTDGGRYPQRRGDGREIVYAALDGRVLAAPAAQHFAVVPTGVLEAKNELRLIVNWPARAGVR
jgi:Tol biopolymer transport system component